MCARADPGLAPKGQDSRVVGAIALMFHDRQHALRKAASLRPPLPPAALDYSLWLARAPPAGLEHERAAFLWWTGVQYKMRRCGLPDLAPYKHCGSRTFFGDLHFCMGKSAQS